MPSAAAILISTAASWREDAIACYDLDAALKREIWFMHPFLFSTRFVQEERAGKQITSKKGDDEDNDTDM